jgi:hypothetical protein
MRKATHPRCYVRRKCVSWQKNVAGHECGPCEVLLFHTTCNEPGHATYQDRVATLLMDVIPPQASVVWRDVLGSEDVNDNLLS